MPNRRKDNTQCQSIHNPPIAVHNMAIPELTGILPTHLPFDLTFFTFHPVSNWRRSFFPTQLKLLVPADIYFAGLRLLDLYFYTGVQINWSHLSNKGHPTSYPNYLSTRAHQRAKMAQLNLTKVSDIFPKRQTKSLKIQNIYFWKWQMKRNNFCLVTSIPY